MEKDEGLNTDSSASGVSSASSAIVADVSRLPWWRRPPLPAIVAVVLVVAFVFWWSSDDAFEVSDLALLPKNSSLIVVVNVDAVNSSDLVEFIRDAFSDQIRDLERNSKEKAGFVPEDLSYFVIGGNVEANDPVLILAFEDEPDAAALRKLVGSFRIQDEEPHEVDGYRVWGSKTDRMSMLEIRGGTYLVGRRAEVEHALGVLDSGGSSELAELMDDHDLLEAPIAAVFDFRGVQGFSRSVARELRAVAPAMAKHIGPILARAEIGDGIAAEWMLLNSDNDVVIRSTTQIDGDFLQDVLKDVARWANQSPPPDPMDPVEPSRIR